MRSRIWLSICPEKKNYLVKIEKVFAGCQLTSVEKRRLSIIANPQTI